MKYFLISLSFLWFAGAAYSFPFSLGTFGGAKSGAYYTYEHDERTIFDEIEFETSIRPMVGLYGEIELLSWFSLQSSVFMSQHWASWYTTEEKQPIKVVAFTDLSFLFEIKFFFRIDLVKISWNLGIGPKLALSPREIRLMEQTNKTSLRGGIFSQALEISIRLLNQYEVRISGMTGFESGGCPSCFGNIGFQEMPLRSFFAPFFFSVTLGVGVYFE